MTIYISTDEPLPTIPYDEKSPKLNTQEITDTEMTLKNIFSKPYIKYVGSDQGCGCGFRHALLQDESWLNVINEGEDAVDNRNHLALVDLISKSQPKMSTVEILSVWDGDHNEPIKYRQALKLSDILDGNFHFNERGLYIVQT